MKEINFICLGFIISESEKRIQNVLKFWQSLLSFDGPIPKIMFKKRKKKTYATTILIHNMNLAFSLLNDKSILQLLST